MSLCIVVHHRNDSRQPWVNAWLDNDRIDVIQTTPHIGRLCEEEKNANRRVLVHRCGWGTCHPKICCSALIELVDPSKGRPSLVKFKDAVVLDVLPPISPSHGQNFYRMREQAKPGQPG